jgi:aminodeoxyfutalosine deaminase
VSTPTNNAVSSRPVPRGPSPKIELHVHLEGTVRPKDLLEIARRNNVSLPAGDEEALSSLYEFRDFDHFVELWVMTTSAIKTGRDFHQIVTSYAEEAWSLGAVYIEAIFTPAERVLGGASWDEVFTGFCDGADESKERFGVEVRLTPDIPRGFPLDAAMKTARYAAKYRERGVVGIGLGGLEAQYPPGPYAEVFRYAKDSGLGSVPHAGEVVGPESVRSAIDDLGADRIRHGIRAVEDPSLVLELADRGIVCDVCPVSNLRTAAVASLPEHPLARMLEAGVPCSIGTDDPAMFDTDLDKDYRIAADLGCSAEMAFDAGLKGALCDDSTRRKLAEIRGAFYGTRNLSRARTRSKPGSTSGGPDREPARASALPSSRGREGSRAGFREP